MAAFFCIPRSSAPRHARRAFGEPACMKRFGTVMVSVLSLVGCAQRDKQIAAVAQPAPMMPQHSSVLPAQIPRMPPESGKHFVYVSHEVQRPGCYAWTEGMTLTDVIEAAGGLTCLVLPKKSHTSGRVS
jgi:hypothetical protein